MTGPVIPDDMHPTHVAALLAAVKPLQMTLAEVASGDALPGLRTRADVLLQRVTDLVGGDVCDEAPWAILPCEQGGACGDCRPCVSRVAQGYAPELGEDGALVWAETAGRARQDAIDRWRAYWA